MLRMRSNVFAMILVLVAAAPVDSQGIVALDALGGSTANSVVDNTVGWAFELDAPVVVEQLGYLDFNGDGLQNSYTVTLWTESGSFRTSAIVPAGSSANLIGTFRFVPISPILLPAGRYVIGAVAQTSSGDRIVDLASTATADGVTFLENRAATIPSADLVFPGATHCCRNGASGERRFSLYHSYQQLPHFSASTRVVSVVIVAAS